MIKYSVVVLLDEEQAGFSDYILMLTNILQKLNKPFEIIIVANGTENFLRHHLKELSPVYNELKALNMQKKSPESVCLKTGFNESSGEIIMVCGPYQQLTENSYARLFTELEHNDHIDIISPKREKRVDPGFNQFQSRLFNTIVRKVTGSNLHDLNCAVKVLRREVLEEVNIYGNMYRFLPVIAAQKRFVSMEVPCGHFQEYGMVGIYKISDYLTRILDILTLLFNTKFTRKPFRFFSAIGMFLMGAGVLMMLFILLQRIFGAPAGNRLFLLIGIFLMVLGVQVASTGFLGVIIAFTHGRHIKGYNVKEIAASSSLTPIEEDENHKQKIQF